MANTRLIFLRHAETKNNPSIPADQWVLSDEGTRQADNVATLPIMESVDEIFVSEELKASLTAAPIAKKLGKEIHTLQNFDEVRRGKTFLSKEAFENEKVKQLSDLSYRAFDGESGLDALERFKSGVETVKEQYPGKTILIVTHGTVLNIYFADLMNVSDKLPERWSKTAFCAVGIVEDGKLVRDIVDN